MQRHVICRNCTLQSPPCFYRTPGCFARRQMTFQVQRSEIMQLLGPQPGSTEPNRSTPLQFLSSDSRHLKVTVPMPVFPRQSSASHGLKSFPTKKSKVTMLKHQDSLVFRCNMVWHVGSLKITPASDPKQCVGGQQQKIRDISQRQPPNTRHRDKSQENCLQDICLCLLYTSYLKILCRSHVSDSCRSVHQWGSATRSTSSDSCLNIFASQAPLQDPCLWIHVSASMCISGSSARSMLPDS